VRRLAVPLLALVLAALPAAAVEVHLRDGTVLQASSYTVTGSFVMLTLADGRQVAYDVVDVDLEALKKAEGTVPPAGEAGPEPSLSQGRRQLVMPPEKPASSGLAITDADVKHVRDEKPAGGAGQGGQEAPPSGPPPGYSTGGRVVLNNLEVTPQGEDSWLVEGEVVNRLPQPVINVKVQLQTVPPPGQSPWSGEVEVAAQLMPGEKGAFTQAFSAPKPPDKERPDVRASVIWMQQGGAAQNRPPNGQAPPTVPGAPGSEGYD
jgi:hypothetical protein